VSAKHHPCSCYEDRNGEQHKLGIVSRVRLPISGSDCGAAHDEEYPPTQQHTERSGIHTAQKQTTHQASTSIYQSCSNLHGRLQLALIGIVQSAVSTIRTGAMITAGSPDPFSPIDFSFHKEELYQVPRGTSPMPLMLLS
jgi:hypothetical protein